MYNGGRIYYQQQPFACSMNTTTYMMNNRQKSYIVEKQTHSVESLSRTQQAIKRPRFPIEVSDLESTQQTHEEIRQKMISDILRQKVFNKRQTHKQVGTILIADRPTVFQN